MTVLAEFLSHHPVFVPFTCMSLDYQIGRIPVRGAGLAASAER